MNYNDEYDDEELALAQYYANARERAKGGRSFRPAESKSYMDSSTRDVLENLLSNYDEDMNYDPTLKMTTFPQPEMLFDGNTFGVYYNGLPQLEVPAMSGQKGFQNRESTQIQNYGSIPEGDWYIDPDKLEEYSPDKENISFFRRIFKNETPWNGGTRSWGKHRIRLYPDKETETFNRGGFFLHGGDVPGSHGCIDTTKYMEGIVPYIRRAKKPIRIGVQYRMDDWEK